VVVHVVICWVLCGSASFGRNARARSFLAHCTRCNVCIASGTHVHVRFIHPGIALLRAAGHSAESRLL
jgi:hypothetical protein